ncbi:MAG: hypothetical protein AAF413_03795 [Patescibacteria group bacterium]
MRSQDKTMILISVVASAVVSLIISNFILGGSDHKTVVKTVEPLSSTFIQPDAKYFNSNSLNPTKEISIGGTPEPIPVPAPDTENQPEAEAAQE